MPQSFIATHPVHPRSSAKMLVVNRQTGEIFHSRVSEIADFLPPDTNFVVNNTRVIKARIFGHKKSGGKIECIVIKPLPDSLFLTLIRGKVRVGDRVLFEHGLSLEVVALNEDGSRVVAFFSDKKIADFASLVKILERIGHMPLPPYIQRDDKKSDEIDYQSRFAQVDGSVAAPTASLHFDDELLEKLRKRFNFFELTLHVGLGTFRPVEVDNIALHKMHSEYFEISERTKELIASSKKILCIGTTVARAVEYCSRTGISSGECDIFITPSNPPKRVDMLLTNFHLPRSTLIMLVASLLGLERTLEIYEEAKREGYRFFSYGDAMLIL